MSISARDQQALGLIEADLARSVSHGGGRGACPVTGAAACRQVPAPPPAPGQPGAGAAAGKGG
jgi:hypothetical protein